MGLNFLKGGKGTTWATFSRTKKGLWSSTDEADGERGSSKGIGSTTM